MAQMQETKLVLEGLPLPPFSARGIKQTYKVIDGGSEMKRTANGRLVAVATPELRKYSTSISCEDMAAPAFEDVWKGTLVTAHWLAELYASIPAGWASIVLTRDPVLGGVKVYDKAGTDVSFSVAGRTVTIPAARAEAVTVAYRPVLDMLVMDWNVDVDEWGAVTGWSLDLEEV